jgi:hypothetical protein
MVIAGHRLRYMRLRWYVLWVLHGLLVLFANGAWLPADRAGGRAGRVEMLKRRAKACRRSRTDEEIEMDGSRDSPGRVYLENQARSGCSVAQHSSVAAGVRPEVCSIVGLGRCRLTRARAAHMHDASLRRRNFFEFGTSAS